jgi:hypothetical protein
VKEIDTMVKIDAATPSPIPAVASDASKAKANPSPASRATVDTFEPGLAPGPFAAVRPGPGGGLTPAELASANDAISRAHGGSPEPVVRWLMEHPDGAKQDAFMDHLFHFGAAAGEILDRVYTHGRPRRDAETLAKALGHAWRSGAVTSAELREAVAEGGRGAVFGQDHLGFAQVVGLAGETDLTQAYLRRELEIFQANPDERARANAVAAALGSLPKEVLSTYLDANPKIVESLLKAMADHQRVMGGSDLGHARLLAGAARVEPPTPATLRLFSQAIDRLGRGGFLPEAAAAFYAKHTPAVLGAWRDDSGSLTLEGQKKLSALFARTLFSDLPVVGRDVVKASLAEDLARRSKALDAHGGSNPPPIAAQRDARLMGSLTGAVEGGFQIAVDELKQRNAAIDSMVDLVMKTSALLPKVTVPGVGGVLADQALDAAKSRIVDWVKNSLHEKPRDASEAMPFHVLFGQEIDSPGLRTGYDAARADAFLNRAAGLR